MTTALFTFRIPGQSKFCVARTFVTREEALAACPVGGYLIIVESRRW